MSWTQGPICYEQLNIVDDMNESGCELRALDFMKSSGPQKILMTEGHELWALDDMNGSESWAQGYEWHEWIWVRS